jgi:two-component sensor histidine kinase
LTVRHVAESAGQVRRYLVQDLLGRGLSRSVVEDAGLVISELVSNAVRYAYPLPGDVLRVVWELTGTRLCLRVVDGGGRGLPHRRSAGPRDTHGRGLAIVESVAARWGVDRADGRPSMVWAELALRPTGARH